MYYNQVSAFDRTPISSLKVENTLLTVDNFSLNQLQVGMQDESISSNEVLQWLAVIGLGSIGIFFLIRYLDSPVQSGFKNF
jgi:hypothetical protein